MKNIIISLHPNEIISRYEKKKPQTGVCGFFITAQSA